jgi:putative phosphoribosyl transferase
MIWKNRKQAGEFLAKKLLKFKNTHSIVLALPRGGVPVAAEIATALDVPMDVLIVRKIGAPFQEELAVGALCEENENPLWNTSILLNTGLEPNDLNDTIEVEQRKIRQQIKIFRAGRKLPSMKGKIAIVVDDGLATGATVTAAIDYLKKMGALQIIVAVPIAAASSARQIRRKVDELIALEEREDLFSVGSWYQDFSQVSDHEVRDLLKGHQENDEIRKVTRSIGIPIDQIHLDGDLTTFPSMKALIVFAHGSGSSRKSPRNQQVARELNNAGFGTLLFDLLTNQEAQDRKNIFDIEFLSNRLVSATQWIHGQPGLEEIPVGYFGASTGAGAAIRATAKLTYGGHIYAIVSRGGRPDLAGQALTQVRIPTLLLVGGNDFDVIELNRQAQRHLVNSELSIIPAATHLFEEPGTLDEVSRQAIGWFNDQLQVKKDQAPHYPNLDETVENLTDAEHDEFHSHK